MWLSQVWSRGFNRMRRTCFIGRTITGWRHASFRSTGPTVSRIDFTKRTSKEGLQYLQPRPDVLYTTTGKHSISRYPTRKINGG